jgi:hypothetical protein
LIFYEGSSLRSCLGTYSIVESQSAANLKFLD